MKDGVGFGIGSLEKVGGIWNGLKIELMRFSSLKGVVRKSDFYIILKYCK